MKVKKNLASKVFEHQLWTAGIALVVLAAAVGVGVVTRSHDEARSRVAQSRPALTSPERPNLGVQAHSPNGRADRSTTGESAIARSDVISRLAGGSIAAGCRPGKDNAIGVTSSQIRIGQIVTDSNQLPALFKSAHEGLQAFVNVFNAA